MQNINAEIESIIREWQDIGFKGIRFRDIYNEKISLRDFLNNNEDRTIDDYQKHLEEYGIFVAEPNDEDIEMYYGTLNYEAYYNDVTAFLEEKFKDLAINVYSACHEFEIYRD